MKIRALRAGPAYSGRLERTAVPARAWLLPVLIMLAIAAPVPAEHFPGIPETGVEVHNHGRLFYYNGDLSGMVEYVGRFEEPGLEYRYQSVTLGGYYRLHPNVKVGAFYRGLVGARHDDDWLDASPGWEWNDTRGRLEHLVMLDVTPRVLLEFLPGRSWVSSFKARYEYNLFNDDQTLLARPGVTWFWLVDRQPLLNVSAQYATYLSLNFGDTFWYRHGPYLNLLYHVAPWLQVDLSVGRQSTYWSESADFRRLHPGESYNNNVYSPWIFDLGMIVTLRE